MSSLRAALPISALPFWESHRGVYISTGVGGTAFVSVYLLSGSWFASVLALGLAIRISLVGKPLVLWGAAVSLNWLLLTWLVSGVNLIYPPDLVEIARSWSSDTPINGWVPGLTFVALLAWLGPARWGETRTKAWIGRHSLPNVALILIGLVALLMVGRLFLSDFGMLVRLGAGIGVFLMGWQWLNRLQTSMKKDLKQMVVDSSVDRSRSDVADARIASLTRAQAAAPQVNRSTGMVQASPLVAPAVPQVVSVFDPLMNGGGEDFTTSLTSEDVEAVNDNDDGETGEEIPLGRFHDTIDLDLVENLLAGSEDDDESYVLLRDARALLIERQRQQTAASVESDDADLVQEPEIVPIIPPESVAPVKVEVAETKAVEPVQQSLASVAPVVVTPSIPEISEDQEHRLRIRSEAVRLLELYKRILSSGSVEEKLTTDILPLITEEHEEVIATLEGGLDLNRSVKHLREGKPPEAAEQGSEATEDDVGQSSEEELYNAAAGAAIMPQHEIERRLGERGRELPEEDEINQLLKRLIKYNGTDEFFSYLDLHVRGLIARDASIEFDRVDFGLCKGLLGLASEDSLAKKGFGSIEAAANRLTFFLAHKVTASRFAKVKELAEVGFQNKTELKWAQGVRPYLETFFEAFPEHQDIGAGFASLLSEAEFRYDFAGTRDWVQEGLSGRSGLDQKAISIGRSRVLGSSLPGATQEALTQFINLQKPIDIIEFAMRQESMITRKDEGDHPLYPAYMALYCRAYQIVCQMKASLQGRPFLLDQLPEILKSRDEKLLGLFHKMERDGEMYETWVREQKDKIDNVASLEGTIGRLTEDLSNRNQELQVFKESKTGLRVDPLEEVARLIVEKKPMFKMVKDQGPIRLQANSSGHIISFVHGMSLNWKVENGGNGLASENGHFKVDLAALRASLRGKSGLDEAMPIRLRVVVVNGAVVGARPQNFAFTDKEVLQNPDIVMNRSEVDQDKNAKA
ncbi:hypothetical protein [Microvirga tunisiensis]|uniref:Uncharacterized protein n=1 Tax=Microvirga tunisiensis TaxID=2108360 RepID=A0A5N7MA79_9HYPH|nr:hypothetical protein [Microvirga tunisiensis]MPR05621.1 hypothetical protein [Microvirga tunisiensis]MPR23821.1 hypothetical protein [Microvirga tunisiensis]